MKAHKSNFVKLFTAIAAMFASAKADGKKVNKNKVYAQHGIGVGSQIYSPPRKKLKGWQKQKSTFNKNK